MQQASISTWVNLSMVTREQHVCASLLLARGHTAMPGILHARLSVVKKMLSPLLARTNYPCFRPHKVKLGKIPGKMWKNCLPEKVQQQLPSRVHTSNVLCRMLQLIRTQEQISNNNTVEATCKL